MFFLGLAIMFLVTTLLINTAVAWIYAWENKEFRQIIGKASIVFGSVSALFFVIYMLSKLSNCCCR